MNVENALRGIWGERGSIFAGYDDQAGVCAQITDYFPRRRFSDWPRFSDTVPHEPNSKYELTEEAKEWEGVELRRIRALRDIPSIGIRAGDLGGWVDPLTVLSLEGDSWIADNATVVASFVVDNAWVGGDAFVALSVLKNDARVQGEATVAVSNIGGNAVVEDSARVECRGIPTPQYVDTSGNEDFVVVSDVMYYFTAAGGEGSQPALPNERPTTYATAEEAAQNSPHPEYCVYKIFDPSAAYENWAGLSIYVDSVVSILTRQADPLAYERGTFDYTYTHYDGTVVTMTGIPCIKDAKTGKPLYYLHELDGHVLQEEINEATYASWRRLVKTCYEIGGMRSGTFKEFNSLYNAIAASSM